MPTSWKRPCQLFTWSGVGTQTQASEKRSPGKRRTRAPPRRPPATATRKPRTVARCSLQMSPIWRTGGNVCWLPKMLTSTASWLPSVSSTSVSVTIMSEQQRPVRVSGCQARRCPARGQKHRRSALTCPLRRLRLRALLHHAVQVTRPRRQLLRLSKGDVRVSRAGGSRSSHGLLWCACGCACVPGLRPCVCPHVTRLANGNSHVRLARAKRPGEEVHVTCRVIMSGARPRIDRLLPLPAWCSAWHCRWRWSIPHSLGCPLVEAPLRRHTRGHGAGLNAPDSLSLHACLERRAPLRHPPEGGGKSCTAQAQVT